MQSIANTVNIINIYCFFPYMIVFYLILYYKQRWNYKFIEKTKEAKSKKFPF